MPHAHVLSEKFQSNEGRISGSDEMNFCQVATVACLRNLAETPAPQGLPAPLYSRVCVVGLPVSRGAWTDQRHAWGLRAPRSEPVIAEQLMRDGLTVLEIAGVLEGRR